MQHPRHLPARLQGQTPQPQIESHHLSDLKKKCPQIVFIRPVGLWHVPSVQQVVISGGLDGTVRVHFAVIQKVRFRSMARHSRSQRSTWGCGRGSPWCLRPMILIRCHLLDAKGVDRLLKVLGDVDVHLVHKMFAKPEPRRTSMVATARSDRSQKPA